MWNNLKSDLYRVFHMKTFYVTLFLLIAITIILLTTTGFSISNMFFKFYREQNSFSDFLFYMMSSPWFSILVLIFLCILHNDEYDKGFAKNIMPITYKKNSLVIERYLLNIIISVILCLIILAVSTLVQFLNPLPVTAPFHAIDFLLYAIVEILLLCTLASFLMMLNHLTRSKVILIILVCLYTMVMIYLVEVVLLQWLFGNSELLQYTIYQIAGTLLTTFSWEGYHLAFFVIIGNTLLYNGISYLILKKKDI